MSYLEEHRNEIFKKYSEEELIKDIDNFINGKGRLNKVLNQFFEECIFNCTNARGKKTPMEALDNDEDMKYILSYISTKTNFYTGSEVSNVKSFFRNAGKLACKVANFPPKEARSIYFRYFPNALTDKTHKINVLDTSCGFGSRMSAVLLSGHNYFGFDPNKELQEKLFECAKFYYDNGFIDSEQKCDLYSTGSENFIPELENTIDVSFTSPPYFNLETYSNDGGASTENYNNYQAWLEYFVKPTIMNTYRYLKVGGYAMINIKNSTRGGKEKLFDDWYNIFCSIGGFEPYEVFEMNQTSTKVVGMYANYDPTHYQGAKEPVMCFKKVR
jgi:hypothetical protein